MTAHPQRLPAPDVPPGRLEELASSHGSEVSAIAVLVLQHRQEAERAALACLLEASRQPDPAAGVAERRLDVLRIACRRAVDTARRSGAVDALAGIPLGHPGDRLPPGAIPPAALVAAMAALSPRARALVALRYVLELEPEEIGHVMRQPDRRVERQLREALERLRELLEGDEASGSIEEIGDAW